MANLPPTGWSGNWSELEAFVFRLYPAPGTPPDAAIYPYQIGLLQGGHGGSLAPAEVINVSGMAAQDAIRTIYATLAGRLNRITSERTSVTFRLLPQIEVTSPVGAAAGGPWPDPTVRLDFVTERQAQARHEPANPWQGTRLEDSIAMAIGDEEDDELELGGGDEDEELEDEDEEPEDEDESGDGEDPDDRRTGPTFENLFNEPGLVRRTRQEPAPTPPPRQAARGARMSDVPLTRQGLARVVQQVLRAVPVAAPVAQPAMPQDVSLLLIQHLMESDARSRDREGDRLQTLTGTIEALTAQVSLGANAAVELERARTEQVKAHMQDKVDMIREAAQREQEMRDNQIRELQAQLAAVEQEGSKTIEKLARELNSARTQASEAAVAAANGADGLDGIIQALGPEVLKRVMDRVMPGGGAAAPAATPQQVPEPVARRSPPPTVGARLPPAVRPPKQPEARLPPRGSIHRAHAEYEPEEAGMDEDLEDDEPEPAPMPPAPTATTVSGDGGMLQAAAEGINQLASLPPAVRRVVLAQVRRHLPPGTDVGGLVSDLSEAILDPQE